MQDCLRCTCILRLRGAFFARGEVAADVLRDGHGQDVGWLPCLRFHHCCVSPPGTDPRDAKFEATVPTCLATFTEHLKLEILLILWGDRKLKRVGFCVCEGQYHLEIA